MKSLSEKLNKMEPSRTITINSKAKEMKKEGIDVINLSAGQPDFKTPDNVKQAGIKAINDNQTEYTTTSGIIELKEAIIEKLKKDNGIDYNIDQIIVSCGAKHSIYNALNAILNPEDEVIIISPYWVSYPEMVKLAAGSPIIVETKKENDFKITPEELQDSITGKTKAVIMNSPSNPTGAVYSEKELKDISQVILKNDIYVISDEIYEYLIYDDNKHCSFASFGKEIKDLTILVNGVSKSASMTGWRIGYTAAHPDIVKNMNKIQGHSTSNPTSISQYAALVAVKTSKENAAKMQKQFDERRKYIYQALSVIKGIKTNLPGGAFYIFPDVSYCFGKKYEDFEITDSMSFCEFMLEKQNIAIVPGVAFGNDNCVRISYATSMDNIKKAMVRLKEGLDKLV